MIDAALPKASPPTLPATQQFAEWTMLGSRCDEPGGVPRASRSTFAPTRRRFEPSIDLEPADRRAFSICNRESGTAV